MITVEKAGFRAIRQENIRLDVGGNRSADLVLEVGAISQEVQVEAVPPSLDFSSSSIGQVIENKRIMDLPLNGRSAFSLAENNVGINNRQYEPQVDAVAEFNVQVNPLAAEYGRFAGGVINVATKSGTNLLHGTA